MRTKSILIGLIGIALLAPWPALAQKTKATLNSEISANFPNQNTGAITPAIAQATFNDFVASWQQAPMVRANTLTSDTIALADYGALVTENNGSAVAVTLPQATGSFATFNYYQSNLGNGVVTITPQGGSTINGASTYTLSKGQSVFIISDGTNWQVVAGGVASPLPLQSGGTNAALVASNGGIVYSTGSALAILGGTPTPLQCLLSGSNSAPSWGSCTGVAAVTSVSNSDSSLTISPTSGNVVASLNVAHANTWTVAQTFNLNAASLPAAQTGTVLQIGQANTTTTRIELDAFAAPARYTCVREDGTAASPTTLQSGDEICSLNAFGYDGAAIIGPQASIRSFASQNWTTGQAGTYINILTTPNGTLSLAESIRFENDGGITVPSTVTGGDKGAGTLNVQNGIYVANNAVLTANQTITLSGDITGSGQTSIATTLATVNSNVGSFGASTAIPNFTVNAKGLITAAGTNVVIAPAGTLTGTTLASNVVTSSLTTVGTIGTGTWQGSVVGITYGGTGTPIVASNGGIVYSNASTLALLAGTGSAGQCLLSGSNAAPTWGSCSGAAAVSSVSNSDGTLTISPTTGAVVASLALGHANTWTAAQTFTNSDLILLGSSTGTTTFTSANASGTNYTATIPANTGTVAELNLAQTWTAIQTFTNSDIKLLGSSTGATTFTSANAGSSNFTLTFPAVTDTIAVLGTADQVLAGGANVTTLVQSAGSLAIDCGARPLQTIPNTGAFNFTAPTSDGTCVIQVVNMSGAASPGYVNFSGKNPQGASFGTADTSSSTVTVTSASPGIVSWTAHGLVAGTIVYFTNSGGSLPTGISAGTQYFVCKGATLLTNSFAIATSMANAIAGTCVNTSSTGTGTQTAHQSSVYTFTVESIQGLTTAIIAQQQ